MTRINPQDRAIYVWIPPGEFMMGASIVDSSTYEDEQPQHRVRLDGFWLMQTEVTNAQYKRCVEAKVCARPSNVRWSDSTYADHPVVDVAWTQADRYAEWVGGRLPTEAEWEKACTGTDGSRYPWGNQAPDPHLLNYAANNKNTTMPVGSYPFGANRLYDMAGNVGEWTADWYAGNYYTDAPEHNPKGPKSGVARTLRGGSFDYYDYNVRCVARDRYAPDLRFDYLGFRVAASGD